MVFQSGPLQREVEEARGGREHVDERGRNEASGKGEPDHKARQQPTDCASRWSPECGPVKRLHGIQRQSRHLILLGWGGRRE